MADDLSIVVGSQQISGWTSVRVTRGIERLPSDFQVELTEYYPENNSSITVQAGQPCKVMLGADLVLTGYVDEYGPGIGPDEHAISISGRSKCEDLVDCSAEYPNSQIGNTTALQLCQKLAMPYGISVSLISGENKQIPQFSLMFGETAVEVIERICRSSQLLYYDMPDGNLVLAQIGTAKHSSGFQEGVNVKSAKARYTMDQRFSEYQVVRQALYTLADLGEGSNLQYDDKSDIYVGRNRKKIIVTEAGDFGFNVTKQRAEWEAKRRFGKSFSVSITTDSWRDSAGKLWTPNQLVHLQLPRLKIPNADWVIGDVSYMRDEKSGTTAQLNIYPPTAFSIEPILLQVINQPELGLPESIQPTASPAGNGQ